MPLRPVFVALVLIALLAPPGRPAPGPWRRTEVREPCAASTPLRNPYFGDLHVHTKYSADAYIFGTRVGPRDAYAFAKGQRIPVVDENELPTRNAQLERPLDFTAVTDHAEFFGEVRLCDTPASLVYGDNLCQLLRQAEPGTVGQDIATVNWLILLGTLHPPSSSAAFCSDPGVDCDASAVSVWQDIQAAAEEAYDRTGACTFTSFVGYEHTPSPGGRHLHRNVIFRNAQVPAFPKSFLDTFQDGTPQGLWSAIENECLHAGTGCDAVIIPHNANLSEGAQFFDPADAAEAARRQTLEPLVEIHQVKGNSECRFDRLAGLGAGTNDEFCTFEQDPNSRQGIGDTAPPIDKYPTRNMVRNVLKDGLAFEEQLGVNPFRLGFTGSTDTHNGTPGNVDEAGNLDGVGWKGAQGNNDASPALQISENMRTNPGGLTAVWAEENSRDALFDALRRRETYATSGTRPLVRFFGGDLASVRCGAPGLIEDAYERGTPMGGELGAVRGRKSPHFVVWAMKDPGTDASPGTDLQRVQIVKGWLDAQGTTHEQVFDVAGGPGGGVDPATCRPTGTGAAELCAAWRDPGFDRRQRAFYYVRVLENPSCRWSTLVCKQAGVDPLGPDCAAQAMAAGPQFANCCLGATNDAFAEPLIQERAWTSPIWYRPDGIARVAARIRFGKRPAHDALTLRAWLGRVPDVAANGLTVRVTDDGEIFAVTVPAGALRRRGAGVLVLPASARPAGVRRLSLAAHGQDEAVLTLETGALDLAAVDRGAHMVTVAVTSGVYEVAHTRRWVVRGDGLVPRGR